jgi:hypothetical protein
MIRLATVIESFAADCVAQYRHRLRPGHYRALAAIQQCRTAASRQMQVQRTQCPQQQLVPHSCGHRHCPHCQHHESQQWLERQLQKQVPTAYFMLTFTLPAEFRPLAWAQPGVSYDLLLRCSWDTVRAFSQNDRQLQGTPGAIAVLHTNTRQLEYHPHVHLVMPAATLDAKHRRWRTKQRLPKGGYLFVTGKPAASYSTRVNAGTVPSRSTTRRGKWASGVRRWSTRSGQGCGGSG